MDTFTAPYRLVPVNHGHVTYFKVLDAEGYPVAQGTQELCEAALTRLEGRS